MFGLSTTEILIILAVALIFVGPNELPKVARTIGKSVAQIKGAVGKVDSEMRRAMREAASEFDDDGEEVTQPPPKPAPEVQAQASAHPASDPPGLNHGAAPHEARDWSSVGKSPVSGRVATTASTPPSAPEPNTTDIAPPSGAATTPPLA